MPVLYPRLICHSTICRIRRLLPFSLLSTDGADVPEVVKAIVLKVTGGEPIGREGGAFTRLDSGTEYDGGRARQHEQE